MNKFYSVLLCCWFTSFGAFAQFAENYNISENEFFSEKSADTTSVLAKVINKYKDLWVYVDYKTGDASNCKGFLGNIEKENDNAFEIINNNDDQTDIWVDFMLIKEGKYYSLERKCFVKYNESFTVKNLKAGTYKLSVQSGNKWKQPIDFSCKGQFVENYKTVSMFGCSRTFELSSTGNISFTTTNVIADCKE